MAHFAKLNQNNIVTTVHVVHNNELLVDGVENEQKGIDFLNNFFNTNDNWKQTSYNTRSGIHQLDGTPFRKNYAGIGMYFDASRDAFYVPQPFPSWTLDEDTCQWNAPVAYPDDGGKAGSTDGKLYQWNEDTTSWDEV